MADFNPADSAPTVADAATLAHVLRRSAHAMWQATLAGGRSPQTALFHDRVSNPKLGDLVAEISARARPDSKDVNAVGYLIAITEQLGGGYEYTISTLDGRNIKWNNCEFIAFPSDRPLIIDEPGQNKEP